MEIPNYVSTIKVGCTARMYVPFLGSVGKVHIMYILDSYYKRENLIVYRVYGKSKQWWHEFMMKGYDFNYNVHLGLTMDEKR